MTSWNFRPPAWLRQTNSTSLRAAREMASSSLHSLTVLTEEDSVPGSKFEREPEEYTVDQLKRWLKCRGLKLSGKREDLVQWVRDCVRSGNLSPYLESILHSPQQRCLVPTMPLPFRTLSHFLTKFSVVLFQFYSSRSYISFEQVAMFVWVCAGGLIGYHVTKSIFSNSIKRYSQCALPPSSRAFVGHLSFCFGKAANAPQLGRAFIQNPQWVLNIGCKWPTQGQHQGPFPFNPKFRKFLLVHQIEWTILVWFQLEYSGPALKVVSLDRSGHFGWLDWNVRFHLTKLLSPILLFCILLARTLTITKHVVAWVGSVQPECTIQFDTRNFKKFLLNG